MKATAKTADVLKLFTILKYNTANRRLLLAGEVPLLCPYVLRDDTKCLHSGFAAARSIRYR